MVDTFSTMLVASSAPKKRENSEENSTGEHSSLVRTSEKEEEKMEYSLIDRENQPVEIYKESTFNNHDEEEAQRTPANIISFQQGEDEDTLVEDFNL